MGHLLNGANVFVHKEPNLIEDIAFVGDDLAKLRNDSFKQNLKHHLKEFFFAAVVVVEQGFVDASFIGDALHAGTVHAFFGKFDQGSF